MTDTKPLLSHPKYRPDIDGLRAVAVLAVVIFHAFPNWIKGGFIGVDVFFVISGYLISTILFENLDRGTFSFSEFYSRRIKRIFPALILILVACYIFGWFALLADEYTQLGKYIAAGAAFASNFVLWSDSGYFDNSAETKPLLHLWSLGIEEQFYILWPLLLWFAWVRKFNLLTITTIVFFISFILNITEVKQDTVSAFYSPQTRFWELLIGSLLAWTSLNQQELFQATGLNIDGWLSNTVFNKMAITNGQALCNVLSITGTILLLFGFLKITKDTAFPGTWALIPALGGLFIITAGPKAWVNRKFLSHKIVIWFGLISFPLYLWHWPLLSFARIIEGETPSKNLRIGAILVSIILAWLTYKFIERPIRLGKHNLIKVYSLILIMTIVGLVGYQTYRLNGLSYRNMNSKSEFLEQYNYFQGKSEEDFWKGGCFNLKDGIEYFKKNNCDGPSQSGRSKVFIIGDSHSAYLGQYFRDYLTRKKFGIYQYSTAYCTPLSTLDKRERCRKINNYIYKRIAEEKPEFVVIFGYYSSWSNTSDYGEAVVYDELIKQKVSYLKNLGVDNILLLGHIPTWSDSLPHVLARRFVRKLKTIPIRTYDGITDISLEWDAKFSSHDFPDGVHYLSLKNLLCNQDGCLTTVGPDFTNDLVVFDYGHLTKSGSRFVTEELLSEYIK